MLAPRKERGSIQGAPVTHSLKPHPKGVRCHFEKWYPMWNKNQKKRRKPPPLLTHVGHPKFALPKFASQSDIKMKEPPMILNAGHHVPAFAFAHNVL